MRGIGMLKLERVDDFLPAAALATGAALGIAAVLSHTMLGNPHAVFLLVPGGTLFGAGAGMCMGLDWRDAAKFAPVFAVMVLVILLYVRGGVCQSFVS